ncbi:hypothetical protein G6011_11194 [Alternaria panax]|uniref:Uncharacterized protein n=1 Tax=Alternaria panax TaxID=48097 RepID=A0AAD4NT36_9PLEO|nr:hypothetical protein G6011_11194 [Alternaria panax]
MDDANETNWETLWTILVHAYSRKKLSLPGDKLVALSGVARHMMSRIKDIYVAGMWRRSLEVMLMWKVSGIGPRPPHYRAPSWSWASTNGLIWFNPGIERQSLIYVEDVVLDHATDDSTGAVTGGWLDLRGCLKPMRLRSTKNVRDKDPWPADWYMIVDSSTMSEHHANTTHEELITCLLDTIHSGESAFDDDNMEERLFFMPGLIQGKPDESPTLWCLLFRLTKSKNKNKTFERIGVGGGGAEHKKKLLLAELDEDTKARLPCLRYENGLHTIRII